MVYVSKRILLAFIFTIVGFSASRLASYAQGCKFHTAAQRCRIVDELDLLSKKEVKCLDSGTSSLWAGPNDSRN